MGRSPLPHMSLPSHLHSQTAKISSCRLIPVKTFFLSLVFLAAFLLLSGIYNSAWGQTVSDFQSNWNKIFSGTGDMKITCTFNSSVCDCATFILVVSLASVNLCTGSERKKFCIKNFKK